MYQSCPFNLKSWYDHNILTVNANKNKCLPVYLRNYCNPGEICLKKDSFGDSLATRCACEEIKQVKYLGVVVDSKLHWSPKFNVSEKDYADWKKLPTLKEKN